MLLDIKNLNTYFFTNNGIVHAVDGIDIQVEEGQTVGVVGESGCGKSVTALSIMGLLPKPFGNIVEGSITFRGRDLIQLTEGEMQNIRGGEISMIFQDPMTSLNPVLTIGQQIGESLQKHLKYNKQKALRRAVELLVEVGMPRAEQMIHEYPHQLSGGMRQRVMIAIAMACRPHLLIADEPTTALDVTIQAQFLDLLTRLKKKTNMAILFITHDMGVVAETCDRVIVMYCGQIVEEGDVETIFYNPQHPYTKGLLQSIPSIDTEVEWLESINGNLPLPTDVMNGCKFASRCQYAMEPCHHERPKLLEVSDRHKVRCFLMEGGSDNAALT